MGIKNVYDVAARAMSAQIVRMNTIASNLANANNVTSSEETAYKPLRPVFKTVYADQLKQSGLSTASDPWLQKRSGQRGCPLAAKITVQSLSLG